MRILRPIMLGAVVLAGCWVAPAQGAAETDETADSAVWLLKKATLIHRNDTHNVLLRALRQMRDPKLEPLFSNLVQKRHPVLRIHGILGLGEIGDQPRIDLARVADLEDGRAQAQLLSAAIDAELLSVEQAKRVMSWSDGPEPAVRVIVASYLAREDALDAGADLEAAANSDNPALKGTAALLKLHRGDEGAMQLLRSLDESDNAARDRARQLVLRRAREYDFAAAGPWAAQVAQEEGVGKALQFEALRTALRFDADGAADLWKRRYDGATRQANRIRLAMVALDQATHLEPQTFRPLSEDPVELIRRIGAVGEALASGADTLEPIRRLLELNHTLASNWVLQHARNLPIERAEPILIELIRHAEREPNPSRFRAQRLERTVVATQQIAEQSDRAEAVLGRLFGEMPMLTQEAMLMGLIRCEAEAAPHRLVGHRESWPSETARALALLLRAKHGDSLSKEQLRKLALIVRGGAGLQDPLRVQAAWIYLKQTDQDKFALASVLGE